jgi:hypothetical protein
MLALIQIYFEYFNNYFYTEKKTHFFIKKISWSLRCKEIFAVYSENHTKPTNTLCGQNAELLIVKVSSTYNYHWALED